MKNDKRQIEMPEKISKILRAPLSVVVATMEVVGMSHQGVGLGVVVFTSSKVSFIMFINGKGPLSRKKIRFLTQCKKKKNIIKCGVENS